MAVTSIASKTKEKQKREKLNLSDLKTIGHQLLTSRVHVHNIGTLLDFITPDSPPEYALESLLSLQSFFTPLLPRLLPPSTAAQSNSDLAWLRSEFDVFVQRLIDIGVSRQSENTLREVVLDFIMEIVKVGNAGKFHSAIYHKLLVSIVCSDLGVDDILLYLLATKYFIYIDVCYFTYISLEELARTLGKEHENVSPCTEDNTQSRPSTCGMALSVHKMYVLLSHIQQFEVSEENLKMWNGLGIFTGKSNKEDISVKDRHTKSQKSNNKVSSSQNVAKKMKLKFTKAWISFLRLPLHLDVYKEILVTLHQTVIPYLSNPIMLCDFLTRSYEIGGVVSIMALSSLYILMTQHGLEYPDFYNKLYALLEPSVFMAKQSSKILPGK